MLACVFAYGVAYSKTIYPWDIPLGSWTGSYDGPTGWSGGMDVQLPDVTVTGRRDGTVTVCNGDACRTFAASTSLANFNAQMDNVGLFDDIIRKSIKKAIDVKACGLLAGVSPDTYQITKDTLAEVRQPLGSHFIDASMNNLRLVGMNGQIIKVTYGDGSTESFKYVTGASMHTPMNDFAPGDGVVRSACSNNT